MSGVRLAYDTMPPGSHGKRPPQNGWISFFAIKAPLFVGSYSCKGASLSAISTYCAVTAKRQHAICGETVTSGARNATAVGRGRPAQFLSARTATQTMSCTCATRVFLKKKKTLYLTASFVNALVAAASQRTVVPKRMRRADL